MPETIRVTLSDETARILAQRCGGIPISLYIAGIVETFLVASPGDLASAAGAPLLDLWLAALSGMPCSGYAVTVRGGDVLVKRAVTGARALHFDVSHLCRLGDAALAERVVAALHQAGVGAPLEPGVGAPLEPGQEP